MMSITDPNTRDRFQEAMEENHSKELKLCGEIMDTTVELCQSHRQFVKSALDACLKKCKDDELLFDSMQTFKQDLQKQGASLKKKQLAISDVITEIQQKEMQKEDIIQKSQKLQEEQVKRRDVITFQNKANKDRLKNLQKDRLVFQDHLGLEIRTIHGKSQLVKGQKLQFVFRHISPADQDSAFIVTMGLKEDRSYHIVSSDPPLDCLPVLEKRLQETNNLPAFLANIRKEFISKARG